MATPLDRLQAMAAIGLCLGALTSIAVLATGVGGNIVVLQAGIATTLVCLAILLVAEIFEHLGQRRRLERERIDWEDGE